MSTATRFRAIVQLTVPRTFRPVTITLGVVIALLPVVFAALYRGLGGTGDDASLAGFLLARYDTLVVGTLLPLTALVSAASALSAEREDGTVLYLLTTTTPRHELVLVRWVLAAVLTSVLVLVAVFATGLVAGGGREPTGVMRAFAVGGIVGAATYSALFLALAAWVRRAMLFGLLYVLLWEGAISGALPAVRYLSVRQVVLGITHGLVEPAERGAPLFAQVPGVWTSVVWAVVVTVAALGAAIWRLQRLPMSRGE